MLGWHHIETSLFGSLVPRWGLTLKQELGRGESYFSFTRRGSSSQFIAAIISPAMGQPKIHAAQRHLFEAVVDVVVILLGQ